MSTVEHGFVMIFEECGILNISSRNIFLFICFLVLCYLLFVCYRKDILAKAVCGNFADIVELSSQVTL